ncbi:hypothetical protein [Streptomyces sp. DG1A-41]|uniref:hypothetical protein n=1 Tax=Streptomyces sp. DG1A-41 TaxID=3125779 RepID=UPI0030D4ED7F
MPDPSPQRLPHGQRAQYLVQVLGRPYVAPPQLDQGERLGARTGHRVYAQRRQHDTHSRERVPPRPAPVNITLDTEMLKDSAD